MGKIRCYDCGHIFDEDDADSRRYYVGEFWGAPAYDYEAVCPECGSDAIEEYEEERDIKKCERCAYYCSKYKYNKGCFCDDGCKFEDIENTQEA